MLKSLLVLAFALCMRVGLAATPPALTETNVPVEISLFAQHPANDPSNTVTLDVQFTDPSGAVHRVPAFWDGGQNWKVRYASPLPGVHAWVSACSDADPGLQNVSGSVEITHYKGSNPLYLHGPVKASSDKRHLQYADGTPFFWLGDTWWMGLCHRLHFPDEFQKLAADRSRKGFTVIQIVAGLYPDMFAFDPRGANEAGFPWEKDYARLRPEYFDAADIRLKYLVDQGLSPCIVGAWGYFLPWMGPEKMKAHWRNLIARYGAYPVIWCTAGEDNLPWYLAKGFPYDDREAVKGWTAITAYVRATDPYHRLLTIHPTGMGTLNARGAIDDAALLDFDMLQTPHGENGAIAPTLRAMLHAYAVNPPMPVVNGEASYEMLGDKIAAEWPRKMFWLCMINGAAGHTYGANGIWQCNRKGEPHGKSPTGGSYGVIPWDESMNLPGSAQVGFGKAFLETLPWDTLVPMAPSVRWADSSAPIPWGDWIWYPEGDPKRDAPVAARYFRRTLTLPDAAIKSARLTLAADDTFTVWINGHEAGHGANWSDPQSVDISTYLKAGANSIAVRAENLKSAVTQNPAGLLGSLAIVLNNGETVTCKSDAAWRCERTEVDGWKDTPFDDSKWLPALVTAHYGEAPWGRVERKAESSAPFALGAGTRLRVIYAMEFRSVLAANFEPGATYDLVYFDPITGERTTAAQIAADANGIVNLQAFNTGKDWVAVLVKR